jgi:hypothetical protein
VTPYLHFNTIVLAKVIVREGNSSELSSWISEAGLFAKRTQREVVGEGIREGRVYPVMLNQRSSRLKKDYCSKNES